MCPSDLDLKLLSFKEHSKSFYEKLSLISENIKKIENHLQILNIGTPVSLDIARRSPLNRKEKLAFKERSLPGWDFLSAYVEESLLWGRDEMSGKFRILYSRTIFEDRMADGYGDAPKGAISSSVYGCTQFPDGMSELKPLIETPTETRVLAWPKISNLLNEIEKKISELQSGMNSEDLL